VTAFLSPTTLDDALEALAAPGAVAVAGCTDLMVVDHAVAPPSVIDLLRLEELRGIERDGDALIIGAANTFTDLRRSPVVRDALPILVQAAATVGGWQIQNRGTLGGNVANASPAGDSLPVLLALEAEVEIAGPGGLRRVPYGEMHPGYRQTALQPGELILRFHIPVPGADAVQAFKKVGTRAAQAISKVVVAMVAERDGEALARVHLAAGSVAATPVRLSAAETVLEGAVPDRGLADRAGAAAAAEVTPIDDVRSTATYRRFALGRVVRRMVLDCART